MDNKHKLLLSIGALVIVGVALLAVLADHGALDRMRLKTEYRQLVQENDRLARQNVKLDQQIQRLKSDHDYIEHIARHELGMVDKNEVILKSTRAAQK